MSNAYETAVLWSVDAVGVRYVAIVLSPTMKTPLAFCGHLHRTLDAAHHCEKSVADRYERIITSGEAIPAAPDELDRPKVDRRFGRRGVSRA